MSLTNAALILTFSSVTLFSQPDIKTVKLDKDLTMDNCKDVASAMVTQHMRDNWRKESNTSGPKFFRTTLTSPNGLKVITIECRVAN